jgi:hypothetical protein
VIGCSDRAAGVVAGKGKVLVLGAYNNRRVPVVWKVAWAQVVGWRDWPPDVRLEFVSHSGWQIRKAVPVLTHTLMCVGWHGGCENRGR